MSEVSFVETSSVLDETHISMNVSIGGADGGQMVLTSVEIKYSHN